MNKKLSYEEASIEITSLSSEDIITTSGFLALFGFPGKDDSVDYGW